MGKWEQAWGVGALTPSISDLGWLVERETGTCSCAVEAPGTCPAGAWDACSLKGTDCKESQ